MSGRISATEAAQLARVSRERLLRKVQQGEIEGELVGGRWMISEISLQKFLRGQPKTERRRGAEAVHS
jgi:excisionase family DNA binding protein